MRTTFGLGVAVTLLAFALVPAAVAADVVFPLECPPGLDVRGHHERDCWPRVCTSDSQCGAGASCRQVSRCIETRQIHEGDSMDTTPRDFDDGPCGAGDACTAGGTCRQLSRCEPTESTASFVNGRWTTEPYVTPPSSMCAASVPASRGGALVGPWFAALGLSALGLAALARPSLRARRGRGR